MYVLLTRASYYNQTYLNQTHVSILSSVLGPGSPWRRRGLHGPRLLAGTLAVVLQGLPQQASARRPARKALTQPPLTWPWLDWLLLQVLPQPVVPAMGEHRRVIVSWTSDVPYEHFLAVRTRTLGMHKSYFWEMSPEHLVLKRTTPPGPDKPRRKVVSSSPAVLDSTSMPMPYSRQDSIADVCLLES